MNDIKELKDDVLKNVVGGWSQNEDGTYNFNAGDSFRKGHETYTVLETVLNATLDKRIRCYYVSEDENGMLANCGEFSYQVSFLLFDKM